MDKPIFITPEFAVTSALAPKDFAEAAALGFGSVLSSRPDGEAAGQLSARAEAVLAWQARLDAVAAGVGQQSMFIPKRVR